nr:pentatricopeptide repeat-containing protein DOT4, chloroplastic-like [Malus domestica]
MPTSTTPSPLTTKCSSARSSPDRHTLPRVLSASRLSVDLSLGKQLHAHAHKLGCSGDRYVVAALIELYGRLDSADSAKGLFDKSLVTDSVSWTMLARLYIAEGKPGKAVHVFERMVESGAQIDSVAVATAAGACGMLRSLIDGTKVHRVAKERGLEYDVLVSNTILKIYMDCGCVDEAWAVFNQIPEKDVISWTEMIHANVKRGCFNEGLKLFRQMVGDGVKPDPLSVSSVLPACARMSAGKHGKRDSWILAATWYSNESHRSECSYGHVCQVGIYQISCKSFCQGRSTRDLVSWTVMITGYSLHGQGKIGVDLFCQMEKETSTQIDEITYAAVLHACVAARMVEEGKFYFNCIKTPTVAHCALFVTLLSRSGLFYEAKNFIADKKDRSGSRHA